MNYQVFFIGSDYFRAEKSKAGAVWKIAFREETANFLGNILMLIAFTPFTDLLDGKYRCFCCFVFTRGFSLETLIGTETSPVFEACPYGSKNVSD